MDDNEACSPRLRSREACEGEASGARDPGCLVKVRPWLLLELEQVQPVAAIRNHLVFKTGVD